MMIIEWNLHLQRYQLSQMFLLRLQITSKKPPSPSELEQTLSCQNARQLGSNATLMKSFFSDW